MHEVTMPKLSDSMEAGRIIEWRVQEGEKVSEGDILAEIESDKAAMELECFHDGVLVKILYGNDTEAPVGEVIALIAAEGEAVAEVPAEEPKEEAAPEAPPPAPPAEPTPAPPTPAPRPAARPAGARVAISPYARKLAEEKGVSYAQLAGSGPGGRIVAKDIEAAAVGQPSAAAPPPPAGEAAPAPPEARAEPLAANLAAQYGIAMASVSGTGVGGRITVADVLAARTEKPEPVRPSPDEELPPLEVTDEEATVEDAPFRLKTQARIVTASKHVIPHFYLTRGVDVTALMERKAELKEKFGASITHLVMLACVKAVEQHPEVNRSYDHGRVIHWKGIHLGLAVGTDAGLTVVVVHNAQDLSLREIVERTRGLVEKARGGTLSAEERRHPTLTITNLGMFDVEHFQPIVNPPSAITLAVASALEQPIVCDGGIRIGRVIRFTTSCDHRIIEGVHAAAFLHDLRAMLEDPDALLEGQS